MLEIEIDHREPNHIVDFLHKKEGIKVSIVNLNYGDFRYQNKEKKVIIERKYITDLVQSIHSNRLWNQIQRLASLQDCIIYLIISGTMSEADVAWSQRGAHLNTLAIYGAVASITVRYPNIHVLWVPNDDDLCVMVWKIVEKISEGKYNVPRVVNYTPEAMLSLVLKISLNMARRLILHFGSLKGVVLATDEQLMEIRGIGPKIVKQIRKRLGE